MDSLGGVFCCHWHPNGNDPLDLGSHFANHAGGEMNDLENEDAMVLLGVFLAASGIAYLAVLLVHG